MLKELAQYLAETLSPTKERVVPAADFDLTFFDKPVHRAPGPVAPPLAKPLGLSTLRSFADYLIGNVDELDLSSHLIHVVDPARVELVSKLELFHRRREPVLVAYYVSGAEAVVDKWLDLETAVISLMALFTEQGDRSEVLNVIKSISRDNAELRDDNGLSQAVTIKQGIVTKAVKATPNPVTLAPFRTFPEIAEQPTSLFVLRLKEIDGAISVLLKPADGSLWKVQASQAVAECLGGLIEDHEGMPSIIC